jgi:hypothetical protein
MARSGITLSDQALEAFDSVVARLKMDFDRGVGFTLWSPTQSKVAEFLAWTFKRLLEKGSVNLRDLNEFMPATLPQGRKRYVPTAHQFSVASKMLIQKLQREPTHDEVMSFLKRNPDIGKWEHPLAGGQ